MHVYVCPYPQTHCHVPTSNKHESLKLLTILLRDRKALFLFTDQKAKAWRWGSSDVKPRKSWIWLYFLKSKVYNAIFSFQCLTSSPNFCGKERRVIGRTAYKQKERIILFFREFLFLTLGCINPIQVKKWSSDCSKTSVFLIALTPAGSAREGDGDAAARGQGTQQGTGNLLCQLLLSMLSTHRAIRTRSLHIVYGTRYWTLQQILSSISWFMACMDSPLVKRSHPVSQWVPFVCHRFAFSCGLAPAAPQKGMTCTKL